MIYPLKYGLPYLYGLLSLYDLRTTQVFELRGHTILRIMYTLVGHQEMMNKS